MQNDTETSAKNGANLVQRRSGPVRYRLVGPDGFIEGIFNSPTEAAEAAGRWWPDLKQNEDGGDGWGWDIEVVR